MQRLIILALVGFLAQLVDGSLGMAYGVTSTSLLLIAGVAPAAASASVHLAEVVTTAASGVSHLRFGNVDKQILRRLIIPGSIGAFLGACLVSYLPGNMIKPYVALFLFTLGIYVFSRFLFFRQIKQAEKEVVAEDGPQKKSRFYTSLGFVAGFFDASGGGGWGPLTTPILLTRKQADARKVVGTVDTSEFAIALAASLGFLISLGWGQVHWEWVIALMIGGVIAAPIAAWIVRMIPSRILGVVVGGLIIFTNLRTLLGSFQLIPTDVVLYVYVVFSLIWVFATVFVINQHVRQVKVNKS
jgi:uncharacterized membrane protein YfcA